MRVSLLFSARWKAAGIRIAGLSAVFVGWMLLSACASGTKFSELEASETRAHPEKSQIIVYRTQIFGAGVQPVVHVNGKPTGTCAPKGVFVIDVDTGQHHVSAETETTRNIQVTVSDADRVYVRCSIDIGLLIGRPKLELVHKVIGQQESSDLSFTGRY